ncbi:DUF916 domain-containing protein [Patescibacteria group bacterium]|nr:DUF916 domain-containing protein [Patescibacteria group bacterium]
MKSKMLRLAAVLFLFSGYLAPLSAKATTISPPFFDYSLNPGDTVSDVIKIYNESDAPLTLYPIAVNFSAGDDESGIPQFYSSNENINGMALAEWLQFSSDPITMQPHERANLSFSLVIPKDGQPGGHYGGIFLSTEPEEKSGSVGLGSKLASLILLRVSGDIIENAYIEEFGFLNRQRIYTHLPVSFFVRFKNEGTTHLRPTGNAFIKNMFGLQSASIEVNPEFASALPNSIRKYFFDWQKSSADEKSSELMKEIKNFGFGRYKATVVLTYGQDNKFATAERTFWVIPWMLIILGLVVLVILWFMLNLYNRSIVKNYERKRTRNS